MRARRAAGWVVALLLGSCGAGEDLGQLEDHAVRRAAFAMHPSSEPPTGPDVAWTPVTLPDRWSERQPSVGGSGWYRFEVASPPAQTSRWAVYLPKLNMNAAVFVNGMWIGDGGSFHEPVAQSWNRPLYFELPRELLDRERNVVHVRLYAYPHDWGGLDPPLIGPDRLLRPRYERQLAFQVRVAQLASVSILVLIAFVGALAFRRSPHRAEYGYFVLAGAFYFVHSLAAHVRDIYVPYPVGRWLIHTAMDAFVVSLVACVHRLAGVRRPRLERTLWLTLGAGVAVTALVGRERFGAVANLVHALAVCAGAYVLVMAVRWLRALPRFEAALGTLSGVVALGLGVHGLAVQLGLLPQDAPRLLGFIAPALLLGFGAVIVARHVRTSREAERLNRELEARVAAREAELSASFGRLQRLESTRLLAAERERIMREMHDGMGGQLVAMLAMVEQGPADPDRLREAIGDTLCDMRIVVDSLDPDTDDIPTLLGMLRMRLGPQLDRCGVELTWRVTELPRLPRLGPADYAHIQRIVQEAITNALRHSGARAIEVSTRERAVDGEAGVEVTVQDDGTGVDEGSPAGRGLRNMRHRAAALGGTLAVRSGASGTSVELWLPVAGRERQSTSINPS